MAMLMVAMTALYRSLRTANATATAMSEMNQQQTDARRVVDLLVNDLRASWTGNDTMNRVDSTFGQCTLTVFVPTRDAIPKLRRIAYAVAGTTLTRSETFSLNTQSSDQTTWSWPVAGWSPAVVVLRGIDNLGSPTIGCDATHPIFKYYQSNDTEIIPGGATPLLSAAAIKRVALSITIDRILGKFPEPDVFNTSVELRSK